MQCIIKLLVCWFVACLVAGCKLGSWQFLSVVYVHAVVCGENSLYVEIIFRFNVQTKGLSAQFLLSGARILGQKTTLVCKHTASTIDILDIASDSSTSERCPAHSSQ